MQETIFKTQDNDIDTKCKAEHIKIYMNLQTENKTIKINLSKQNGSILYILSEENHDDFYDYFQQPSITPEVQTIVKEEPQIKKSKQGNLFGFFKK